MAAVPWAAFTIAIAVVGPLYDDGPTSIAGLVMTAPIYLAFVGASSWLPLAATPAGRGRLAVLAVMTAASVTAGVWMVSSDDAQAGLAVLFVPYVGVPLAIAAWIANAVLVARRARRARAVDDDAPPVPAEVSDRLVAVAIDALVVGGVLFVPLTNLSGAGREVVAALVGLVVATAYLAVPVALAGRSFGQALLGIRVISADTGHRVSWARAVARSAVVVIEVTLVPTFILALPAIVELSYLSRTGQTLTDRVLRADVVKG